MYISEHKALAISRLKAEFADKFHNWNDEGQRLSTACLCSTKKISVQVTDIMFVVTKLQSTNDDKADWLKLNELKFYVPHVTK